MAGSKNTGYVMIFIGVFLLGLSIPLFDIFLPRAVEEGGLMVNILFLGLVVSGGVLFLFLAWQKLRGPRNR